MIVIEGTVRIPPENVERARAVIEQMIRASRAEPGSIDYAYSIDVLDAGLVGVTERWEGRAALDLHFKTAHMVTRRAFYSQLGPTHRSLRLYEAHPEPI